MFSSSSHIHGPHPYGEWYPQPQREQRFVPAATISIAPDGTVIYAQSIVTPQGYYPAGGLPKNAVTVQPAMTIGTV